MTRDLTAEHDDGREVLHSPMKPLRSSTRSRARLCPLEVLDDGS